MRKLMLATTALVTAASFVMGSVASAASYDNYGNGRDNRGDRHDDRGNGHDDHARLKGPFGLGKVGHIVVIYAENHSFDEEFGTFPGANGLRNLKPGQAVQRDRDGSVMKVLPPVFGGVIDSHEVAPNGQEFAQIPQSATTNMPNAPFSINGKSGFGLPASVATRDMYHRFYNNQMQIDGGKNDKMAAWADSGGIVMGHYEFNDPNDAKNHPLWALAREYVLADNFFQAAFGGSYLNHQYLICACANTLTPAQQNRPKVRSSGNLVVPPAILNADGVTLTTAANNPASALNGPPVFAGDNAITPLDSKNHVYYFVNTSQPPYAPSGNADPGFPQTTVNPDSASTVPPQTATTIGDLLSSAKVSWAWYAGAMQYAIDHGATVGGTDPRGNVVPNFQFHHNPFNYYVNYAPGTKARQDHLKDGGLGGANFIADIDAGKLPAVTFYKPQGNLNGHPGYTDLTTNDEHIIDVVNHLKKSKQWKDMVIIVTYDEFGGQWDHVAPPKGDSFGPGTRIPAIIISPFAKKHMVDHTQYDTTSILKLITEKYDLPVLPGLKQRDDGLVAHGHRKNGDLTNALRFY